MKALSETVLHYCFNSGFHEGKQGGEVIAGALAGVGLPAFSCTRRGESVAACLLWITSLISDTL